MSRIEDLAALYERHIGAPWQRTIAGAQRVLLIPSIGPAGAGDGRGRSPDEVQRALDDKFVRGGAELRAVAEGAGWSVVDRIPLPLGDELLVYGPPS